MTEFDKWYYYVKSEGKSWPSFGRYDTEAELIAAKEAWRAALEWILADLKAARDGFDLGIYDTLNKELGTENERVR